MCVNKVYVSINIIITIIV